ncbi:restriction endonuclease [Natrinema sp. LN54]
MDNEDFEHLVADLWERQGWQTQVSQKSRDRVPPITVSGTWPAGV